MQREVGTRSVKRILVVTEGTETEPNYFEAIRKYYRFAKKKVRITSSFKGTAPKQVIESALELFFEGNTAQGIEPLFYDEIYVVFDRDEHLCYLQALDNAISLNKKHLNKDDKEVSFTAISTNPCFEYWFLLHFENCSALYHRDKVDKMLKKYIPKYNKADENIFEITRGNLGKAIEQAECINLKSSPTSKDTPFTNVPELIKALIPKEDMDIILPPKKQVSPPITQTYTPTKTKRKLK